MYFYKLHHDKDLYKIQPNLAGFMLASKAKAWEIYSCLSFYLWIHFPCLTIEIHGTCYSQGITKKNSRALSAEPSLFPARLDSTVMSGKGETGGTLLKDLDALTAEHARWGSSLQSVLHDQDARPPPKKSAVSATRCSGYDRVRQGPRSPAILPSRWQQHTA